MGRSCLGFAVLVLLGQVDRSLLAAPPPPTSSAVIGPPPDPRQASAVGLCPTAADLARLRSLVGQPQRVVLATLGHPTRVLCRPDGSEIWKYPWLAVCEVHIKGGKCIRTFYTGGY